MKALSFYLDRTCDVTQKGGTISIFYGNEIKTPEKKHYKLELYAYFKEIKIRHEKRNNGVNYLLYDT